MHEVARLAVLERITTSEQDQRRDAFIRNHLPDWAPVMRRLAES